MFGAATQNGVGVSLGNIPALTSLAYPQMLNAIVLGAFSGGAPGWLYDDTNQSTLYQDAAGTTPVTALEQPVGLQLDLSQGLAASTGVTVSAWTNLGGTPYETFTSSGSTITSAVNSSGTGFAFTNKLNMVASACYKFTINVTLNSGTAPQVSTGSNAANDRGSLKNTQLVAGVNTIYVIYNGDGNDYLWLYSGGAADFALTITNVKIAGNHRYQPTSANRPTWSARYNLLLATASLSTQSVTTVATNYVLYFTGSGTVTLSGTSTGTLSAGSNTITCTAGTLTLTVSGSVLTADLRPADQAVGRLPPYQAVVTASNYDSVGFPAGLRWNGSNSWMQNASTDFSGTNKVSVFVGVRKLSDAAVGIIAELSTIYSSSNGSWLVASPSSPAAHDWYFGSRGTSFVSATSDVPAPTTNVVTGLADLSTYVKLRLNGVQKTDNENTQGGGNYGNYPAYFGARAGSSLFFNGLTFSNVCIGIALSASQIAAFEAWTNARARAYV